MCGHVRGSVAKLKIFHGSFDSSKSVIEIMKVAERIVFQRVIVFRVIDPETKERIVRKVQVGPLNRHDDLERDSNFDTVAFVLTLEHDSPQLLDPIIARRRGASSKMILTVAE